MKAQVQTLNQRITKTQFFIIFWTLVLGPFEYFVLDLPFTSVLMIRLVAIGSNIFWYQNWFERKFWNKYLLKEDYSTEEPELPLSVRISRMVSMKFLVNVSNFTLLFAITILLASVYDTGLHFTLMGFMKKVAYITGFAIVATWPYEKLLAYCGFESNDTSEVDLASDI